VELGALLHAAVDATGPAGAEAAGALALLRGHAGGDCGDIIVRCGRCAAARPSTPCSELRGF
jgi:hypothetical protein